MQQKDYVRLTKDGMVAYRRGEKILYLPAPEKVRERLITLLEQSGGDVRSQILTDAFNKISALMTSDDQMIQAYNAELHELMTTELNKLVIPLCPWCKQSSCWCCWECGNLAHDHKPECKYAKYSDSKEDDVFSAFGL